MENEVYIAVVNNDCSVYAKNNLFFRPSEKYPEYIFEEISDEKNEVYSMVREVFHLLKYDNDNYGTSEWNPLKDIVKHGDTVLIKPNLVMHKNGNQAGGTDCLYTQPDVVAPVVDYVLKALNGSGKVIIGDAPMQECDFEKLLHDSGYLSLIQYYEEKNLPVSMVDFRGLHSNVSDGVHYAVENKNAKGVIVSLDTESDFSNLTDSELSKMRITNYDPRILPKHHNTEKHEYYISSYVLDADVIINMPKPKTHRKAGVTISLKNLVGANTRKEFLPHHMKGSTNQGGDEYLYKNIVHELRSNLRDKRNIAQAEKRYRTAKIIGKIIGITDKILRIQRIEYSEGSWYGNDTISRTISDINRIVLYADKTGKLQDTPQRKELVIADMIVSGEKEGPVAPSPKNIGIIAGGENLVCFDEAVAMLMGFEINKIPTLKRCRQKTGKYALLASNDIPVIVSNNNSYHLKRIGDISRDKSLQFVPTSGWKNHIEAN